jgi:hypothetical protein
MHPVPLQAAPWLGPRRDCPHVGESMMDDNGTPTPMQQDHPGQQQNQNLGSGSKLKSSAQHSGAEPAEPIVEELEKSPMSAAALDFVASRGVHDNVNISSLVAPDVVASSVLKVIPLSPFHGSTLSLYNHIHPAVISSLDLNLDLVIPPYHSLPTVIDILKLIKFHDCLIQAMT